ncbi:MAG: zinc-ribbon domain containing protein [Planctomycetota bacterium]|nr:zinc-ribbon domain containing protein [Planctomycetota bacterium]MDI6787796.1 zinc-ribbon domain containing protein [Planctomycetota bacterium]
MADKQLKCVECGSDFAYTEQEQQFHQEKGYRNEPKRCPTCRQSRRRQFDGNSRPREYSRTEVTCAGCGQPTTVPFKPRLNRPVYCDSCFAKNRASTGFTPNR